MLRHNLSTRPFYNIRLVKVLLWSLGVLLVAVTFFNILQVMRLSSSQAALGARAAQSEEEAARLLDQATRIRAQTDARELSRVAAEAREANSLIDRRAFSWTGLFSQFEVTLPGDVRVTAVQPRIEPGAEFVVSIATEARQIEALDAFIEALEMTGTFRNALAVQEQTSEDGLIEAVVEATYAPEPEVVERAGVRP